MFTNVENRQQAELVRELGLIHPATSVGSYRPHPMAARYEGPAPVQVTDRTKTSGALRRRSIDLTRALAEMREP